MGTTWRPEEASHRNHVQLSHLHPPAKASETSDPTIAVTWATTSQNKPCAHENGTPSPGEPDNAFWTSLMCGLFFLLDCGTAACNKLAVDMIGETLTHLNQ